MSEPASPVAGPPSRPQPRRANRQVVGPFTLRHLATLGVTLLAVAIVLIVLTLPIGQPAPAAAPTPGSSFFQIGDRTAGLAIGQPAPELAGTVDGKPVQLTDLDGNPIRLADLRGRPVWVNFFATWCGPCQQETPVLRSVYDIHKAQGLALIAISVQETTPDDIRNYVTTYGLDATIGFDGSAAVFKAFQAYGLPTNIFLDRNGIVRAIQLGPVTQIQAEQILAPLLAN